MERPLLLLLFVLSVVAFLVNELFAIQGLSEICAPCTEERILHMLTGTLTALLVAVLAFEGHKQCRRGMCVLAPSVAEANKSNDSTA